MGKVQVFGDRMPFLVSTSCILRKRPWNLESFSASVPLFLPRVYHIRHHLILMYYNWGSKILQIIVTLSPADRSL